MIDPDGMTEVDRIQDLEKHALDQGVVADVVALLGDAGEQITFGAKLNDHVGAVDGIHDADQGNHVGVLAGQVVELDLPLLVLELAGIQSGLVEGLDSIQDIGMNVDGRVDDAIGTDSQDAGQLQPVGQEQSQTVFRGIAAGDRRRRGRSRQHMGVNAYRGSWGKHGVKCRVVVFFLIIFFFLGKVRWWD